MRKIFLSLLLVLPILISGQVKKVKVKSKLSDAIEEFYVFKKNKAIRHGSYCKKKGNKILVEGDYKDGLKQVFSYYSYKKTPFLKYDFANNKIISKDTSVISDCFIDIQGKQIPDEPAFPLFSVFELQILIAKNIRYPVEAQEKGFSGKSKIALKIDEQGSLKDLLVFESSHDILDKESIRVIDLISKDWNWLPAKQDGKTIESFFIIPVNFVLQ